MGNARRIIEVSPLRAEFLGTPSELRFLQKQYSKNHAFVLKNIFSSELNREIQLGLRKLKFKAKSYSRLGHEEAALTAGLNRILDFFVNHEDFLSFVRQVTKNKNIKGFAGRIYRMNRQGKHHFNWHNDKKDKTRLVGMSINLSPQPFEGGVFQLRESVNKEITFEFANTGFCDAHIFEIDYDLEHRVTSVKGDAIKMSFAGWFTE